jgi:hypothetical protein
MPYKSKEDRLAAQRRYYARNVAKVVAKVQENNKRYKNEWDVFKGSLKCERCGEDHPATLDFHHINPAEKEYAVSSLVRNKQFAKAKKEVEKCEVLCANCHRKHHHEENLNKMIAQIQKSSNIGETGITG